MPCLNIFFLKIFLQSPNDNVIVAEHTIQNISHASATYITLNLNFVKKTAMKLRTFNIVILDKMLHVKFSNMLLCSFGYVWMALNVLR